MKLIAFERVSLRKELQKGGGRPGYLERCVRESIDLSFLNSSSAQDLAPIFKAVCHTESWVQDMIAATPFEDLQDLQSKGAAAWSKCGKDEWMEALDGHPRIGQKAKGDDLASKWSRGEQSQAATEDQAVKERLAAVQETYYQRFGFIFLIFASGRSSAEILAAAETRMENSADRELEIVAEELAKIIHLRLEKLLS